MNYCKDCARWTEDGTLRWKRCEILHEHKGDIFRGIRTVGNPLRTHDTFGCNEFTEKPKGPFTIGDNPCAGYWIYYEPTDLDVGVAATLEQAKRVCEELNWAWRKRK